MGDQKKSFETVWDRWYTARKKIYDTCATWNAPAVAFDNPEQSLFAGKGLIDIFLPITSNYKFCGFDIMDSYNCFDIYKGTDIIKDLENYPLHLSKVFEL